MISPDCQEPDAPRQVCRWHAHATVAGLEDAAAGAILRLAHDAICERGIFRIVLAGGTTPCRIYERLAKAAAEWDKWHVYFGDERCLPPDHPERNSRMAHMAWFDHAAIAPSQLHVIPAELGPDMAALRYAATLRGVDKFDLVLLGLGEDGHTASLFPGHEWGKAQGAPDVLAVNGAPKPPPARVSLSARRLSATRAAMFFVTGEGKRNAVRQWRAGDGIPAAAVAPAGGVDVHIEAALLSGT